MRMSSSVQSWVEEHKLATIGSVWAAAVGASVAYSRRRSLIHGGSRMHKALAVLGGAAALMHYYSSSSTSRADQMDLDFYSQQPPATDADGNENERPSW